MIRALAVRTMGCIRVERITEYLCDPLLKALRDEDPYVRKTACICVAKLYDISPELVDERGFLDLLRDCLGDSNPMVVANAVAALCEIGDACGRKDVMPFTPAVLFKLLAALNECTEWGQVVLLDALATYAAADANEAESIVERVTPRLQHANCAVVLSAVKVVLKQLPLLSRNVELLGTLRRKLAPPLVTLLSAEPEIQYVALRNINLILQRYPSLLGGSGEGASSAAGVKVFFCKYNDPPYVKLEKLDIMTRLAREANIDALLLEWREYASEVDVDFVRKAVRCIGRAAIALDGAAERCVGVLLELIRTKVSYVTQEAVVVIRDILRRYPGRYEGIIAQLCENLDALDEPEAKAAMVWIVGEYAERIDNAHDLLSLFADTFADEAPGVQLALLTAAVKLFLKRPEAGPQALITDVLGKATNNTDNPDLRDRAFIYWRLLSSDPEAARDVVLADKPVIADDTASLEPALLDELLGQLSTLASVYHKPADAFVSRSRPSGGAGDEPESAPQYEVADVLSTAPHLQVGPPASSSSAGGGPNIIDLLDGSPGLGAPGQPGSAAPDLLGDLLSLGTPGPQRPAPSTRADLLMDLAGLDLGAPGAAATPVAPGLHVVLSAAEGKGLEVCAALGRSPATGASQVALSFCNRSAGVALEGLQIQFNKNALCLAPGAPLALPPLLPGGPPASATLPLVFTGAQSAPPSPHVLQVALKVPQLGVLFFNLPIAADALFLPSPSPVDATQLAGLWRSLPDGPSKVLPSALLRDTGDATTRLGRSHVTVAHVRPLPDGSVALYAGTMLPPAQAVVAELTSRLGVPGVRLVVKSSNPDAAALALDGLERLLLA